MITLEQARDALKYDPKSGEFRWRETRNGRALKGALAGVIHPNGYHYIRIGARSYMGHRLAWLLHYGEWPVGDLDHRNGKPADNRIGNLRPATDRTNARNRGLRKDNLVGLKGVTETAHGWRARIRVDGRLLHLGYHASKNLAHAAYCRAARKYFGEFARFT